MAKVPQTPGQEVSRWAKKIGSVLEKSGGDTNVAAAKFYVDANTATLPQAWTLYQLPLTDYASAGMDVGPDRQITLTASGLVTVTARAESTGAGASIYCAVLLNSTSSTFDEAKLVGYDFAPNALLVSDFMAAPGDKLSFWMHGGTISTNGSRGGKFRTFMSVRYN